MYEFIIVFKAKFYEAHNIMNDEININDLLITNVAVKQE